jgi:hypothetical protein
MQLFDAWLHLAGLRIDAPKEKSKPAKIMLL